MLGLIEDTQLDQRYVWTVESPTVWRVRRENGTDATRYELDDQRRIVTRTWENGAQPEPVDVWTYDDEGRLIATPSGTTFKYDRGGNIVEVDGFPRKVFDYSCW